MDTVVVHNLTLKVPNANNKYPTVRTVPRSNRKIVKRGKSNTQIHERSLYWLGTGTLIKSGGRESVVFA